MTISKTDLLKKRFGVVDFEIPEVGTVQIRPLSRAEALTVQGVEMDAAEMEQKLVSMAMVEPKLTENDVKTWQENSPAGELEPVTQEIARISGLTQDAAKDAVKTFRG